MPLFRRLDDNLRPVQGIEQEQAVAITDPRFTRIQKNVLGLTADGDPDASFCTANANAPGVNRCQRVVFLEHEFCGCVFELHG